MQLGFVIDQDRCIGCHACTVACKAENDVPVGSFRTWVKSTEAGTFPSVRRDFLVQRCNHCTDAPCVTICPVRALEKRPDGIVDVDRDACIGCKACMQACPYDALYLNEDLGAVEKCHFCAHRVDRGLEPACVVVCPVEAIIPGDLHDPESRASVHARDRDTRVRRPEQRTGPNVRYVGAGEAALHPGTAAKENMYASSERPGHRPEPWPLSLPLAPDARVAHDVEHRVEWGWPVAAYLVTKGIAGGAAMLAPFAGALGLSGWARAYIPEIAALLFGALTCLLLVGDLARPTAFLRMLTRPNPRSWLVRGAAVLGVFMGLSAAAIALRALGAAGAADAVRGVNALGGAAAAGYTAFLFAQCRGRDLWESRILLPHLLVQALLCGAVALLPFAAGPALALIAAVATAGHVAFVLAEARGRHATDNAAQAAAFLPAIRLGPLRALRDGLILCAAGAVLAFALPALALVPALAGLYLYEHAFVRAGQLPPLS